MDRDPTTFARGQVLKADPTLEPTGVRTLGQAISARAEPTAVASGVARLPPNPVDGAFAYTGSGTRP